VLPAALSRTEGVPGAFSCERGIEIISVITCRAVITAISREAVVTAISREAVITAISRAREVLFGKYSHELCSDRICSDRHGCRGSEGDKWEAYTNLAV